jgi:hypothetical protein
MTTMSTTWYSVDDMTVTAENITFTSASTAVDGVTHSQDASAWIAEMWNLTAANSSDGNATDMPHCDTDKPILLIITQVTSVRAPPPESILEFDTLTRQITHSNLYSVGNVVSNGVCFV